LLLCEACVTAWCCCSLVTCMAGWLVWSGGATCGPPAPWEVASTGGPSRRLLMGETHLQVIDLLQARGWPCVLSGVCASWRRRSACITWRSQLIIPDTSILLWLSPTCGIHSLPACMWSGSDPSLWAATGSVLLDGDLLYRFATLPRPQQTALAARLGAQGTSADTVLNDLAALSLATTCG
jgi:hypothetical protein